MKLLQSKIHGNSLRTSKIAVNNKEKENLREIHLRRIQLRKSIKGASQTFHNRRQMQQSSSGERDSRKSKITVNI